MKKVFLLTALLTGVISLSACGMDGYPGKTPDLDICNPGHEKADDCHKR